MKAASEDTKSVSERLVDCVAGLTADQIPPAIRARTEELLIDIAGLCVAARNTDYVKAVLASRPRRMSKLIPSLVETSIDAPITCAALAMSCQTRG